jgi:hypothetical protein
VNGQAKKSIFNLKPTSTQAPVPDEISPTTLKASRLHRTLTEWMRALAYQKHPLEQPDIDAAKESGAALVSSTLVTLHQQEVAVEARLKDLAMMLAAEVSGRLRTAVHNQREG